MDRQLAAHTQPVMVACISILSRHMYMCMYMHGERKIARRKIAPRKIVRTEFLFFYYYFDESKIIVDAVVNFLYCGFMGLPTHSVILVFYEELRNYRKLTCL